MQVGISPAHPGGVASSCVRREAIGFEQIDVTFFPVKLSEQFGQIPGVTTTEYRENDDADLQKGLAANNARLNQLDGALAN